MKAVLFTTLAILFNSQLSFADTCEEIAVNCESAWMASDQELTPEEFLVQCVQEEQEKVELDCSMVFEPQE